MEKEAGESDIDAIEGQLQRVSSELQELQANRDTLRDQRQTLQNEIKAKDGSTAAANASEEAEHQLAAMVSGVEQYFALQIAALILEQRIEDYRKKTRLRFWRELVNFFPGSPWGLMRIFGMNWTKAATKLPTLAEQ